jgi:hypothetical protein
VCQTSCPPPNPTNIDKRAKAIPEERFRQLSRIREIEEVFLIQNRRADGQRLAFVARKMEL